MKRLKSILMSLLLVSCGGFQNQDVESKQEPMKGLNGSTVVFYNMENLFDTHDDPATLDDDFTPYGRQAWSEERYAHKLQQLARVIHATDNQNPAIIGAVEVENKEVLLALSQIGHLKNTPYKIAHFESDDRRGIDCGLLFDSDKLTLIDSKEVPVKTPSGGYVTRDILQADFKTVEGERLCVFVNHWSSRREGVAETQPKRMRAAEVLKEAIESQRKDKPEVKFLVMGDFNDEPNDRSMTEVLVAESINESNDLINLMNQGKFKGKGTIVHRREWYLFDHFIVSSNLLQGEGLKVDAESVDIYSDEKIIYTYRDGGQKPSATYGGPEYYGGYSDHLPIFLRLKK